MTHFGRKLIVITAAVTLLGGSSPVMLRAQTPVQRAAAEGQDSGDLLGAPFESESAGISLRIPKGCQRLQSTNAGDDVGQFGDPKRKWELKITRIMRDTK